MDSVIPDSILLLTLFLLTFVLSAFFTAAETAITEFPNSKLKQFAGEQGNRKILYNLTESPSEMLSLFALIRAITVVLLYICAAGIMNKLPFYQIWAIIAAVVIRFIFCDGLPKRIVLSGDSDAFALTAAGAVRVTIVIMMPLLIINKYAVKLFSAVLRLKKLSDREIVTEEEIMMMVDAGNETGSIEESQAEMISNIFEFSDTPVSDVMTHRTGVIAVNADTGVREIVKKAIDSGFSRLPLCINDIDHIYGIICVKDLLTLVGSGEISENVKAESFFRETIFLPESADCRNAFRRMTEKKMQMAVVMDEYGGTAGIVTLEDLIETIVGNIQDEYDDERENIVKISDDVFIIDGLASPDDVFPVLGLVLPEENEYDTMSAFLIDISGKIPEKNEKCFTEYGKFRFTSLATKDTLITRLKAEKLSE